MNRLEKIQSYLDGKMTEDELLEFKEQLKIDPELMYDLDIHRITDEVSRGDSDDRFRNKLAQAYDEFESNRAGSDTNTLTQRNKKLRIWISVGAAAAMLVLFVFLNPLKQSQEDIFTKYYTPYDGYFTSRSSSDDRQRIPDKAIGLYLEGNYEKAFIEMMNFTSGEVNISIINNFFLGLIAIENGENSIAINAFEDVLREDFSLFHEHARWYLSLVYQKTGEYDHARQNFMDLAFQKSIYAKSSKKILQSLPK